MAARRGSSSGRRVARARVAPPVAALYSSCPDAEDVRSGEPFPYIRTGDRLPHRPPAAAGRGRGRGEERLWRGLRGVWGRSRLGTIYLRDRDSVPAWRAPGVGRARGAGQAGGPGGRARGPRGARRLGTASERPSKPLAPAGGRGRRGQRDESACDDRRGARRDSASSPNGRVLVTRQCPSTVCPRASPTVTPRSAPDSRSLARPGPAPHPRPPLPHHEAGRTPPRRGPPPGRPRGPRAADCCRAAPARARRAAASPRRRAP
jgi:hypothetical protein